MPSPRRLGLRKCLWRRYLINMQHHYCHSFIHNFSRFHCPSSYPNLNRPYLISKIKRGNALHEFTTGYLSGASMLVLSRKRDERIVIGDNIVITVVEVRGDKVRLGIEAPTEVPVHRQEVLDAMRRADSQRKAPPTIS